MLLCPSCSAENADGAGFCSRQCVEEGRCAESDAELQRSLAFWREVGVTRYVREGEALLATSV
jgi:hypothetical protein